MINEDLSNKFCSTCNGQTQALTKQAAKKLLESLSEWTIDADEHLSKTFKFNNFKDAINFANEITVITEKEGHHPDLHIAWGLCKVTIWSHKINALSENDFILALKIEKL